jgi:eukaryotic-like serine/threonine-protein kinase
MAPEQAAGRVKETGPAADIYAFGAILYELLTGRPPFRGNDVLETLSMVKDQPPEPPHVSTRVDPGLEAICLKCLQKEPGDRYPTADALADDLAAFLRGERPKAHSGTARRWYDALLRESPYTDVMTLWSWAIMSNAVWYFICSLALFLLRVEKVEQYAPYYAILAVKMTSDVAGAWFFRIRGGPPFSYVEHQLARIFVAFWMLIFFTMWQYQRAGGAITGFGPIIVFETAFAFSCAATVLGGSFYATACALGTLAILSVLWPEMGSIISAIGCGPALFWVGWKHSRRRPVN